MKVREQQDSRRPAGALALPLSRIPRAWRPLHCVLAHLSERIGGHAQHALIWLAIHAAWPSGLVEVGHRRLRQSSGIPDHALRAALTELDKNGRAVVEGRGKHGVYRRRIVLCEDCQCGNSRHAEPAASVAMSYTLEPGRQNGQRGNSRHETRGVRGEPSGTPVIPGSRPAAASPNGQRPGDVPPSPDPSRVSLRSTTDDGKAPNQATILRPPSFKADLPDRATVSAQAPRSREPPGDATGDPVSSPGDGRLFEHEPTPIREHWR